MFTIANTSDVPEPPTLALIGGSGLFALLWKRKRIAGALLLAGSAFATPIVDQSTAPAGMVSGFAISNFLPGANGATGLSGAQVFTPGVTGMLTRIDLPLWNYSTQPGTFHVELWSVSGSTPVEPPTTPLLSFAVNAASLPTVFPGTNPNNWTAVNVSPANVLVTAGSPLAIVVRAQYQNPPTYLEGGWGALLNANPYLAGAGFVRGANASNTPNWTTWQSGIPGVTQWDFGFRTWVDSDVPEPATSALLGVALLIAGGLRRYRFHGPSETGGPSSPGAR